MKIKINLKMVPDWPKGLKIELTDESPLGRFPVLLVGGISYDASDYVIYDRDKFGSSAISTFDIVVGWLQENEGNNTLQEKELCRDYVALFPSAPKVKIQADGTIKEFPSFERFKDVVAEAIESLYALNN